MSDGGGVLGFFGFSNFRNYRVSDVLYAGKPDWTKLESTRKERRDLTCRDGSARRAGPCVHARGAVWHRGR